MEKYLKVVKRSKNNETQKKCFVLSKAQHNILHILIPFQILKTPFSLRALGNFNLFLLIKSFPMRQQQKQKDRELSYKNTFYPFEKEDKTEGHYGHKTICSRHKFQ